MQAFRRPKGVSDKFPNLINGDWSTTRPFEKVCSDTTMLKHDGKKYDLNLHVDVFNNEIVGYVNVNSKLSHLFKVKLSHPFNYLATL